MKTLIMKELREHSLHLVMMILAGVGSVLLLGWFKQLDSEILLTLLFLFEAPLFVIMLGNHLIADEVRSGTFPFLASLPISRFRIWTAKTLGGLAICVLVYGAFSGIAHLTGVTSLLIDFGVGDTGSYLVHWLYPRNIPLMTPDLLVVWLPLFLFAASYWGTMLPPGLPVLEALAGGLLVWMMGSLNIISALNLPIALALLSASFLVSSWITFRQGGLMTSWKQVLWAVGTLSICLFMAGAIWMSLDRMADARLPEWQMEGSPQILEEGNSVLFAAKAPSEWFDPLQGMGNKTWSSTDPDRLDLIRCLRFDNRTGALRQVGRRGLVDPVVDREGRLMAAVALTRWPGIRTTPRLVMVDPDSGNILAEVDNNARPCAFLEDGRLLYERFTMITEQQVSTEICLFKPGSGTQTLFATIDERPLDLQPLFISCLNSLLIGHAYMNDSVLVDVTSGRISSTTLSIQATAIFQDQKLAIFLPEKRDALILAEPGRLPRPLPGVATDTRFLGRLVDGQLLAVMNASATNNGFSTDNRLLATFNPAADSCRPLKGFQNLSLNGLNAQLSASGRYLLATPSSPRKGEARIIDLTSAQSKETALPPLYLGGIFPAGLNAFVAYFENEMWRVDASSGEARRVAAALPKSSWYWTRSPIY